MATTKPRITVTLTERQHEVLKMISDCGGQSMSSLLGELIEVSLPTFERMANTFRKLQQAQHKERARMVEALDEAQAALEPIAQAAVDQFDLFCGRIDGEIDAAAISPRGESPGEAISTTAPSTNRGATPTRAKGGKPGRTTISKGFQKTSFLKD